MSAAAARPSQAAAPAFTVLGDPPEGVCGVDGCTVPSPATTTITDPTTTQIETQE